MKQEFFCQCKEMCAKQKESIWCYAALNKKSETHELPSSRSWQKLRAREYLGYLRCENSLKETWVYFWWDERKEVNRQKSIYRRVAGLEQVPCIALGGE